MQAMGLVNDHLEGCYVRDEVEAARAGVRPSREGDGMTGPGELVELRAGDLAADLVPQIGGSIAAFRLDDIDLMRSLSDADRAAGNVLGTASFPMVPYANRIAGNAFEFHGRRYTFQMNNPPEIYNVHGTGWLRPWTVTGAVRQRPR